MKVNNIKEGVCFLIATPWQPPRTQAFASFLHKMFTSSWVFLSVSSLKLFNSYVKLQICSNDDVIAHIPVWICFMFHPVGRSLLMSTILMELWGCCELTSMDMTFHTPITMHLCPVDIWQTFTMFGLGVSMCMGWQQNLTSRCVCTLNANGRAFLTCRNTHFSNDAEC